jgi:CTP:phosphocholine cytidylyltransferase-like protein
LLLQEENKLLKNQLRQSNKIINNTINNINNGTLNNNIILVGYGKEDMSKIYHKEILKGLQNGFYSTVKLTDTIHFNPKYPEYHNIYIYLISKINMV